MNYGFRNENLALESSEKKMGALVSLAGSSRMILPEAGKLLVSNISKPPGDQKVARIARKNSSGHMENNMAEN